MISTIVFDSVLITLVGNRPTEWNYYMLHITHTRKYAYIIKKVQ